MKRNWIKKSLILTCLLAVVLCIFTGCAARVEENMELVNDYELSYTQSTDNTLIKISLLITHGSSKPCKSMVYDLVCEMSNGATATYEFEYTDTDKRINHIDRMEIEHIISGEVIDVRMENVKLKVKIAWWFWPALVILGIVALWTLVGCDGEGFAITVIAVILILLLLAFTFIKTNNDINFVYE